jgi:hypothetical protein
MNFVHLVPPVRLPWKPKWKGRGGLEIKDDFGGSIKMTDNNLKDLRKFLEKRFSQ